MKTNGIKKAIQAALVTICGGKANGFVSESTAQALAQPQEAAKFDMQGIPEDRRDVVTVCMTAALVNGRSITPKEAYAEQEAFWKQSNAASLEEEERAEQEAHEFLGRTGLEVEEFDWGCIYRGTRDQLILAGLADAEKFAKLKKLPKSKRIELGDEPPFYYLPLNWSEQFKDHCYSGKYQMFSAKPLRFDATLSESDDDSGAFAIYVSKGHVERDDRGIRERTAKALEELSKTAPNLDHVAELVRAIPTRATWIQIPQAVKAAEEFAKAQAEEKARGE